MPYVLRNSEGLIVTLAREAQPGAELLPADHPEILAFLGQGEQKHKFASMDADLVRVLEDLVDALVSRNLLRITDLPAEAQQKLFERKHFRERMQQHSLNLFGDEPLPTSSEVISTDFGKD